MAKTLRNTEYNVTFTDISSEGFGVCRVPDGRALFAFGGLTGEEARVKVIKEYKNYLIGKVEEIYVSSPHRIESDCGVFPRCGGCAFRHLDYSAELEHKRHLAVTLFKRNAGISVKVHTPLCGKEWGYRNKLLLPVAEKDGRLYCGFYAPHSHRVVPCEDCKLHTKDFSLITEALLAALQGNSAYNEETGKGLLRHIYLRRTRAGDFGVCLIINGNTLNGVEDIADSLMAAFPSVKSFYLNVNKERTNTVTGKQWHLVRGEATLTDTICGKSFILSPASFFQVNGEMTDALYNTAASLADIGEGDTVFDLYCGVGTVGLCICPENARLCGVEIVPEAIENARHNAILNGRTEENACFFCGDASEGFEKCKEAFGKDPDVVLVDPPRSGISESLVEKLSEVSPKRIVYISCNPATLARDVARFAEKGYTCGDVYTVDMFPRTVHVESVVCLSREKADDYIRISVHTKDLKVSQKQ